MRVITGSAKGFGLKAPRHIGLRPTPSRVKEALFSSLASRIRGARVLELFAGTGAFSIEALSQGAASAILVEKDWRTATLIEENLKKTYLQDKAQLLRMDVCQALERLQRDGARFDLIFADPPYFKKAPRSCGNVKKTERFRTRKDFTLGTVSLPPFFSWLTFLLHSSVLANVLAPEGILLIEYFKKETDLESPYFTLCSQGRSRFQFGDTVVSIFVHRED